MLQNKCRHLSWALQNIELMAESKAAYVSDHLWYMSLGRGFDGSYYGGRPLP
jgi:hypothetical protein